MPNPSVPTSNAAARNVTRPGYLVELVWPTVIRLSSIGTVSWGGQTWMGGRVGKVSIGDSGSIDLMNSDSAFSAMVLNYGASDIACRVWAVYSDAVGDDDPELVFQGVTDGASIGRDRVVIRLAQENARTLYSPRMFINAASGFNHLRPSGTKVTWGAQVYTLDRSA